MTATEVVNSPPPIPSEPPPMPGSPDYKPNKFERAIKDLQEQIGGLTWSNALALEEQVDLREENELLRAQVRDLEQTLAPFLAVEPNTEAAGHTNGNGAPKAQPGQPGPTTADDAAPSKGAPSPPVTRTAKD